VRAIVQAPPESELTTLTRIINAHDGDTAGRDALLARAKVANRAGDHRMARADLLRFLKRPDVGKDDPLRAEAGALLKSVEHARQRAASRAPR
jgi:hypothetical protein